jgi:VPDSG-CTERM motif
MKALPKKLLPLILFGVVVTLLFSIQPVRAYTVTLEQVGSNVVATGSGAFNLIGLTFSGSGVAGIGIAPSNPVIVTGPPPSGSVDVYTGFTGPTSFGSGGDFFPNTGSGNVVGIQNDPANSFVFVPPGYVSGAALSDSMTFNNATFASLSVIPGTYVWTWGTGMNQNFTLQIGPRVVPDGGTTVSLLGCALLGLAALRRKLRC